MRPTTSAEEEPAPDAPLISNTPESASAALADGGPSLDPGTSNLFIWVLTVSAGVSGLLFGYDTGVISSTLVSINTDLSSRRLTTLEKGLITSSTSLFALIASPIGGVLADRFGRKRVILIADVLFVLGALWQAISTTVWAMILGRSIIGLAIGAASLVTPLYISELAPGPLRGRLVTVNCVFVTGGQVVAYLTGWLFSTAPAGWRWMVGLGALPAAVQFLALVIMPETPRWLVKADQDERARRVLRKIYGDGDGASDKVLTAIKREMLQEEEAKLRATSGDSRYACSAPTLASLLSHPPHRRALAIACTLQGLQQLCGFNSVMYFSATIFSLLGFSSPTLTSMSVAGTNFAFTLVAFHLIDRVGRRRILLLTIPAMAGALALCAGAFAFVRLPESTADGPLPPQSRLPAVLILVSLVLYVSPYAMGLGSVPWQQSELFPLSVRSLGSALATATNWGCNFVVGLTFLPMLEGLTPPWTFATYAAVCAAGWLVVWRIYPETMGLDLEDVGALLKDGWGVEESLDRLKETKARARATVRPEQRGRDHGSVWSAFSLGGVPSHPLAWPAVAD